MLTSFPRLSTSTQKNSRVCCAFWPPEVATPKVGHVRLLVKGSHSSSHLSCFSVETDTFANNRLSLILHSENPVRHMIGLHVEACAKGAAVLYESLKDAKTANSDHPDHAPTMYANNKEGITGTFFDWMRQEVRKCSNHVQIHLSHTVFQDARREVR